eukprot:2808235-Amphidinium_carterae.1
MNRDPKGLKPQHRSRSPFDVPKSRLTNFLLSPRSLARHVRRLQHSTVKGIETSGGTKALEGGVDVFHKKQNEQIKI